MARGRARLPREHWLRLVAFAGRALGPAASARLHTAAAPGSEAVETAAPRALRALVAELAEVEAALPAAPPLAPEAEVVPADAPFDWDAPPLWEAFPNDEHARMAAAVAALARRALARGAALASWVE